MTDDPTPSTNRPVSVVRADGDVAGVAGAIVARRSGPSIDLRGVAAPILPADVARLADELAAEGAEAQARRHIEQGASLEAAVETAEAARRDADAALEARQAEQRRLVEGVAWCEERQLVVDELLEAVAAAEAAEDEAQARLAAADAKVADVTEQRAAAEGVLGEARRQLAELEVAGSGEHDLRRGLEEAHQQVRDAEAAADAARAAVEAARAEAAAAEAQLAELEQTATVLRAVAAGDPDAVAAALARFESAAPVPPSPEVLQLAAELDDLEQAAAAAIEAAPPAAADPAAEVDAAQAAVAEARARLDALVRPTAPAVQPDWWDDLAARHAAVVDAESALASAGPLGRKGAQRRLEEALAAERAFLDELGYPSHLDALMSGGRPHGERRDPAQVAAATEALEAAEGHLAEAMAHAAQADQQRRVAAELARLRAEAASLVGLAPEAVTADRLRRPRPDADAAADLAAAMGVEDVPDHLLATLARTWLAEHDGAAEGLAEAEAALATLTGSAAAQRAAAEAAEASIAEHDAVARDARRQVEVLEAELGNRLGTVTDPATRAATAAALRDRIGALESRVGTAEAAAAEERAAAATALAEATAALAAAQRNVADTAARLTSLAALAGASSRRTDPSTHDHAVDSAPRRAGFQPSGDDVEPADEPATRAADGPARAGGPDGDLSGDLEADLAVVAEGLRVAAEQLAAAVEAHAAAAVEAGTALEAARTELDRHRAAPPSTAEGAATLEALRRLLDPEQRPSDVLVEPLQLITGAGDDAARAAVLDLVVEAGRRRPLVVVTDDPHLLGWAIELPAEVGGLVPQDALQSEAARADEASDPAAASARRAD